MSKRRQVSHAKVVSTELRRASCGWGPAELDLVLIHTELLRDLLPSHVERKRETSLRIMKTFVEKEFESYLRDFEAATQILLRFAQGRLTSIEFLSTLRGISAAFAFVAEIVMESPEIPVPGGFWTLSCWFQFPLRYCNRMVEAPYATMLEVNSSRPGFSPSRLLRWIARCVVDEDFVDAVKRNFSPHHGPGQVVSAVDEAGTPKSLSVLSYRLKDKLLDLGFFRQLVRKAGLDWYSPYHDETIDVQRGCASSCVIPVPKTCFKARLIAIEDVTLQYFEQGLFTGLCRAIEESPYLSGMIDFARPELNARMAKLGSSKSRTFATIDLSSASDSVGYRFVKELFEGTPLWRLIEPARSGAFFIREERRKIKSKIFATMGNAICFPIETLIFTLIAIEAHIQMGLPVYDRRTRRPNLRVYGDDIVCLDVLAERLIQNLTDYGFLPNDRKTFFGRAPFRESCGGEYLQNCDVTPFRVSRRFKGQRMDKEDPSWISVIDMANRARELSLSSVYRRCVRQYIDNVSAAPPFTPDGRIGFAHTFPLQCMAGYESKWSSEDSSTLILVEVITPKVKTERRDDRLAFYEWLSMADGRGRVVEPLVTSRVTRTRGYSVSKRWLRVSTFTLVEKERASGAR